MLRNRDATVNTTSSATTPAMSQLGAVIFSPSDMKNSVRKKSRSGKVFAVTWMLYGNAPMHSPATSAPISLLRPMAAADAATAAHQPIDTATTISGALAIDEKTHFRTYLLNANPAMSSTTVHASALATGTKLGLAKLG